MSNAISKVVGSPQMFVAAVAFVVVWAASGPAFQYSDSWQLIVNTTTTIITFLIVILIQNTQNRDTRAIQIKLDELIKKTKGASNFFVNIEEVDDAELARLQEEFKTFREKYEARIARAKEKAEVANSK
jgi:low affinity Fe/Cu permease